MLTIGFGNSWVTIGAAITHEQPRHKTQCGIVKTRKSSVATPHRVSKWEDVTRSVEIVWCCLQSLVNIEKSDQTGIVSSYVKLRVKERRTNRAASVSVPGRVMPEQYIHFPSTISPLDNIAHESRKTHAVNLPSGRFTRCQCTFRAPLVITRQQLQHIKKKRHLRVGQCAERDRAITRADSSTGTALGVHTDRKGGHLRVLVMLHHLRQSQLLPGYTLRARSSRWRVHGKIMIPVQ